MKRFFQFLLAIILISSGIAYYKWTMKEYDKEFEIQERMDRNALPVVRVWKLNVASYEGSVLKNTVSAREFFWMNSGSFFSRGETRYVEYKDGKNPDLMVHSLEMEGMAEKVQEGRTMLDSQLKISKVEFKNKVFLYSKDQTVKTDSLTYNVITGKAITHSPISVFGKPLKLKTQKGGEFNKKTGEFRFFGRSEGSLILPKEGINENF